MSMDGKVLPSRKVPIPAGNKNFPQHSPPNPSQTNGNNPHKIPLSHDNQGNGTK